MKKFILFAVVLLTFCSTAIYADPCDSMINTVQGLYKKMDICVQHCGGWTEESCVAGCLAAYMTAIVGTGSACAAMCNLELKAAKYCWVEKNPPHLTSAERPIYNQFMEKMRQKIQVEAAKQEAVAKRNKKK